MADKNTDAERGEPLLLDASSYDVLKLRDGLKGKDPDRAEAIKSADNMPEVNTSGVHAVGLPPGHKPEEERSPEEDARLRGDPVPVDERVVDPNPGEDMTVRAVPPPPEGDEPETVRTRSSSPRKAK